MHIKETVRQIFNKLGYDVTRIREVAQGNPSVGIYDDVLAQHGLDKVHYGCGSQLFGDGWINLDMPVTPVSKAGHYLAVNLVSRHPFQSDCFRYAFAEDFLEHLHQSQSIIFLSESFRTLRPGGVLRLSFPGLKGVLKKHYLSSDFDGASRGQYEAYTMWGHQHFYSEESLASVATHIGFSTVRFVEYGVSECAELSGLDTRSEQKDINIYVELVK